MPFHVHVYHVICTSSVSAYIIHIMLRDGQPVTDDEIVGMLIGLLLAGQHTSSSTTAWLGFFLAKHKDLQVNGSCWAFIYLQCDNIYLLVYVVQYVKWCSHLYTFLHVSFLYTEHSYNVESVQHVTCDLPERWNKYGNVSTLLVRRSHVTMQC